MPEPVQIIVTANTAQAAAQLTTFSKESAAQLTQLRGSAMALREGFHTLEFGIYALGGQRFPMLAQSVMGVRAAMMATRSVAILTGESLLVTSAALSGMAATFLPIMIYWWRAYAAAEQEARSKAELHNQTLETQKNILKLLAEAQKAGLDVAGMQAVLAQTDAAGMNRLMAQMRDKGWTKPYIEGLLELDKLRKEIHEDTLKGFDGEREKVNELYNARIAKIYELEEAMGAAYTLDQKQADFDAATAARDQSLAAINRRAQEERLARDKEAIRVYDEARQKEKELALEQVVQDQRAQGRAFMQTPLGIYGLMVAKLVTQNDLIREGARLFSTTFNNAIQTVSRGLTNVIMGTETWAKALRQIGMNIMGQIIDGILQIGIRWIATQLMMAAGGRAILGAAVASTAPFAAAESAIWATPATLATIASYGGAAASAPAFISAAESMTMASAAFAKGGRPTPGETALVGERGPELFVPDSSGTILPAHTTASLMAGGGGSTNVAGHKVNLHFYDSRPHPKDFLDSTEGQNMVVNIARKNRLKIGVGT